MVATMVEAESVWAIAVGDAIKRELGLRSQRWLAAATGIDPATISRFIQGKQLATLDHLDAMANALGTTRRRLLVAAGYVEPAAGFDLDSLPPDIRRMVDAILREFEASEPGEDGQE